MAQPETRNKRFPCESPSVPAIAVVLVMIFAVAIPRLMLIGNLPATDEGVYAYFSQNAYESLSAGKGLPDNGWLAIYPILLSFVFAFDVNPLISLRLADMLVAVAAGYALFRVIEVESCSRLGATLISLLFVFTMNQPVFIQYGFKNCMFAAYVPLFIALRLGLTAPVEASYRRWVIIGVLLSVSVLLRESFLPLAAVGAFAVLIQRNWRSFFQLAAGSIVSGLLFAGLIVASRGSIAALLVSYQEQANVYAAVSDQRTELFFSSGAQFVHEASIALIIAGIGVIVTLVRSSGKSIITSLPKLAFWLAVTLVPLIEPASKIGFPYHFGVCLLGLAGLAALGWRNAVGNRRGAACLACAAVLVAVVFNTFPRAGGFLASWPQSREVLKTGRWPDDFTDKSNYLMAADVIRQTAPTGGTLAVSGFMYALYPLTGLLPPKPELANLTNVIINLNLSEPRLREALLSCPPDVVMTTSRTDWPGGAEILAAVRNTGIYEQIAEIPTTDNRHYGLFGGLIFRSIKRFPCVE